MCVSVSRVCNGKSLVQNPAAHFAPPCPPLRTSINAHSESHILNRHVFLHRAVQAPVDVTSNTIQLCEPPP